MGGVPFLYLYESLGPGNFLQKQPFFSLTLYLDLQYSYFIARM